jgi:hypothetical protein
MSASATSNSLSKTYFTVTTTLSLQYGRNKYDVQSMFLYREYLLEDVVYSLQSEYLTTTPLIITSDIFLTLVGNLYQILTMSPFL